MSDTVTIRISADTSGVTAGMQEIRGDLTDLKGTVQSAADGMASGFAGMRGAVEQNNRAVGELTASMRALRPQELIAGLHEVTGALKANSVALQEMAAKSSEGKSGFGKLVEGIAGVAGVAGALYTAGTQAAQAIVAMGESSEKVTVLSKQLGLSTHEVQQLQAMAKATGTDFTKLSQSTATLGKNFSKSPDTFRKLGIDIKAGADQMTILTTVADKFAKTADGPQKTAMAVKLMGKTGAEAIPFLNQGGAAISALAQKTDAYGAANDGAVASGTKLGESVNEAQIAWSGVTQTLTSALAPVATVIVDRFNQLAKAFTQSYTSGGLVKTIFDLVSGAIEGVGEIINTLGTAFSDLWQISGAGGLDWSEIQHNLMNVVITAVKAVVAAVVALAIGFKVEFELIAGYALDWWGKLKEAFDFAGLGIEVIKKTFQLFGQVAYDALTLHWGSIASDWDEGLADIGATVRRRGAEIVGDAKKASEQAQGYFVAAHNTEAGRTATLAGIWGKTPSPPRTGVAKTTPPNDNQEQSQGNGGGGGQRRGGGGGNRTRTAAPETATSGEKNVVDAYRAELQDKLEAEKNSDADSTQIELGFWKDKLKATKAGTKDWLAINREVEKTQSAATEEEQQKQLANIKSTLAIKADLAKTETALAKASLQEKLEAIDEEERAGEISAVRAIAMRNDVNRQLRQLDIDAENDDYKRKRDALSAEINLGHLKQGEEANLNRQIEQLEAEHVNRLRTINAQNAAAMQKDTNAKADAIRAKWQSIFQPIVQSWTQSLQGMINGTTNLRKALLNIGNAIETEAIQWMTKVLTRFLVNEATKTAAVEAGATTRGGIEEAASVKSIALSAITSLKQIVHQAAVAAAGAYAAIARIPYVGPILAPAAAAAALYGVYSLGKSVLSAEGGLGEVPEDGTLISAHAREMVLPASLAVPLRQMLLSGGAANNNARPAANDSGTAFHYHDHAGTRTPDDITANLDAFARAIKKAHRAGKLGFMLPAN
jgi:hypothetical protein